MRIFIILTILLSGSLYAQKEDPFKFHVQCSPKRHKPGYAFQIICTPNPKHNFKTFQQNYYFLLDRSNAISKNCYFHNKRAIAAAIALLQPGDTFNIMLFGGRTLRFSEQSVVWNKQNVVRARAFLESHPHGGPFIATNLPKILQTMIPPEVKENEVHAALLFTSGHNHFSLDKQRQVVGKYTEQNQGKVSLFCLASGKKNNLPLLELLSSFNKGELIYATKNNEITERTLELVSKIKNPIAKHLSVEVTNQQTQMSVLLQPKNIRLASLYKNKPMMIYGSTNRLSSFDFTIKGEICGQPFKISSPFNLQEAATGTYCIESQWMKLAVHDLYQDYFTDGNEKHLKVAKELLSPLNLPVALLKTDP